MIALVLALALPQQEPFPKQGSDRTGIVLDEKDQPICGASVELCVDLQRSPWARSIEHVLVRTPLPHATTSKHGEFVLPLTNEQRLLGAAGDGFFWLRVEKPGYQRWCERLPGGIASWLGSRVVLYALDERDRVTLVVRNPRAGSKVQIARLWDDDPDPGETILVPADGKVSVLFPLVPNPRPPLAPYEAIPLGCRARVDGGIWTTIDASKPTQLERTSPRAERSSPQRTDHTTRSLSVTVRDAAGQAIPGARVLLTDTAFPDPMPEAPLTTDARGTLLVSRHARGTHMLRVAADGFMHADIAYSCITEETAQLAVVLGKAKVVRLVTGSTRHPVPFVKISLLSCDPGRPGFELWHATDSLGRAIVSVPEGGTREGCLCHWPAVTQLTLDATDEIRTSPAEPIGWTHVRMPFSTRIRGFRCESDRGDTADGLGLAGNRDVNGLLVRCFTTGVRILQYEPDRGLPIVVRATDLASAQRVRGLLVVDRETSGRRIALRILGADGKPVAGARVVAAAEAPTGGVPVDAPDLAEPADGLVWIRTRDQEQLRLLVQHKEHLPRQLVVPARTNGAADEPLEVRLAPGVPVTLRFLPERLELVAGQMRRGQLMIQPEHGPSICMQLKLPAPLVEEAEGPVTVELREAVAPGVLSFTIQFGVRTIRSRMTRLELGKRVVVDLDEEGAK